MHVAGLTLRNWLRFRGEHTIALEPTIYGVTAQWADNPRRSNWGGKSATMRAIRFALFGKHPRRTEDAWITNGEPEGGVVLSLHEGNDEFIRIDRHRKRGGSTKLELYVGELRLLGDEAQAYIETAIGFTLRDFEASTYFEQKRMSRFVTDKPSERIAIVVGWFRLGPLQEACEDVTEELTGTLEQIAAIEAERRAIREQAQQIIVACDMDPLGLSLTIEDPATLTNFRVALKENFTKIAFTRHNVKTFEDQRDRHAAIKRDFEDAREYHRIVALGKTLRARVEAYHPELQRADVKELRKTIDTAIGALKVGERDVQQKRQLARGHFNGACPVASVQCPIADKLNADSTKNAEALAVAVDAHGALAVIKDEAELAWMAAEKLHRQFALDSAERDRLLERAMQLKPAADRATETDEVQFSTADKDLEQLRAELHQLEQQRFNLEASMQLIERSVEQFRKTDQQIARLRSRADLFREAQVILGRNGAQRRIAERNLAEIERGANYALQECSIDLSLKVQWAREAEGNVLARNCDACGMAFPSSNRVKVCVRCGSARGPHLIEKLEIETSDDSGAAENLGGGLFQLAAADWLRRDRGAAWSTCLLDEIFEALDAENAATLAGHLPRLLRHFGFNQAFVISHHPGHMAAMPAMLEIEAGPTGSRFKGELECQEPVKRKTRNAVGVEVATRVRQRNAK